jgi:hypothetical protein
MVQKNESEGLYVGNSDVSSRCFVYGSEFSGVETCSNVRSMQGICFHCEKEVIGHRPITAQTFLKMHWPQLIGLVLANKIHRPHPRKKSYCMHCKTPSSIRTLTTSSCHVLKLRAMLLDILHGEMLFSQTVSALLLSQTPP